MVEEKDYIRKIRVYIDTSVFGGCFDIEFEEWSNRLMEEFNLGLKIAVISDLTLRELEDAPPNVKGLFRLTGTHKNIYHAASLSGTRPKRRLN